MATNRHSVEFRVVLRRVDEPSGTFSAPGFSVLIHAIDAEDAVRQTEQLSVQQDGRFKVIDVYPADSDCSPARL